MEKDLIISCPECGKYQQRINDRLVCINKGCPIVYIEFDLDWKSK